MERLLNATAGFSIMLAILVLISLRRAHIRVEYSVSWLTACVVLFVLSRNSSLLHFVADMMGITYPPLALLLVVASVFLFVFFRFSVILSDLKDSNIALAQRVAILEYQLRSSHEARTTQSSD